MNWVFEGRAWVFGDDVPNDEGIMPLAMTRLQVYDPAELARHCFEQVNPAFVGEVKPGDLVVGGRNFGYGNPHIQGFLGLKGVGVGVVAASMVRGPLRACVNAGVPVLAPVPGLSGFVADGDRIRVDFESGRIANLSRGSELSAPPLPAVMREVIGAGGGIAHMRWRLGVTEGA